MTVSTNFLTSSIGLPPQVIEYIGTVRADDFKEPRAIRKVQLVWWMLLSRASGHNNTILS